MTTTRLWSPDQVLYRIVRWFRKSTGGPAYDCPPYNSSGLRWTLFIVTLLAPLVISLVLTNFAVVTLEKVYWITKWSYEYDFRSWAFGFGISLYGWFLYKHSEQLIKAFIVSVPAGEHWVLSNKWVYSAIKDPLTRLKSGYHEILAGMREYSTGWHIKFPWETIVEAWKVKLAAELIVVGRHMTGPNSEIEFYTKADPKTHNIRKKVSVRWQIKGTPLVGYLANYVLFTDAFREETIRAAALRLLNELVGDRTYTEFEEEATSDAPITSSGKESLSAGFEKLFAGALAISPTERQIGMFTGKPFVFDYQLDPSVEELMDEASKLELVLEWVTKIHKRFKNEVSLETCFRTVLQTLGLNQQTREYLFSGDRSGGSMTALAGDLIGLARSKKKHSKSEGTRRGKNRRIR